MCVKFCEDYFGVHICIIMFPISWKKYPFPDRSNRDTLTHIVHVVKSNFLLRYAPDCTFSSRKMKKLPSVGGRTPPPPPPLPHPPQCSVATLPRAWLLRSLAKIVPPKCLAHYATELDDYLITLTWDSAIPAYTFISWHSQQTTNLTKVKSHWKYQTTKWHEWPKVRLRLEDPEMH